MSGSARWELASTLLDPYASISTLTDHDLRRPPPGALDVTVAAGEVAVTRTQRCHRPAGHCLHSARRDRCAQNQVEPGPALRPATAAATFTTQSPRRRERPLQTWISAQIRLPR